jgi:hypothetical protein
VGAKLFQHLAGEADHEHAMIDSTIVRAHQHSAGAAKKRERGGDRAQPRRSEHEDPRPGRRARQPDRRGFALSPGQAHDLDGADAFLPDLEAAILIADKAFDAQERVLEPLQQAGKMAVIPPKANRKDPRPCDRDLCKARHGT